MGVLTPVFPPVLVDEAIAQVGRTEQRHRSLPARVMAYFSIGMALYSEGSYEDVLAQLTDGLSWASGWQETYSPPSKSAIFQARARLGSEPLAGLFERVARPIGGEKTPGVWLAGRRLVAVDGTCLDVADTTPTPSTSGARGFNKGEQAAFPQARVVALAECGTHAVFAAQVGAYTQSEATLIGSLLDQLNPGCCCWPTEGSSPMPCGARRSVPARTCCGESAPTPPAPNRPTCATSRTAPGWPTCAGPRPRRPAARSRCWSGSSTTPSTRPQNPTSYRLFTTMLDPAEASAVDLAGAYTQRWEIEMAFDELKTHQRGPRTVLRSKSPDLVLQEIWGHLCCHYAIRCLMPRPPSTPDTTPTGSASSPPSASPASPSPIRAPSPPDQHGRDSPGWLAFLRRLLRRLNPARRHRAAPRVIKRKMPKWHVKRAHHADSPHPRPYPTYAIQSTN